MTCLIVMLFLCFMVELFFYGEVLPRSLTPVTLFNIIFV